MENKKFFFITLFLLLVHTDEITAAGLEDYFNADVLATRNGTSITLNDIFVAGTNYWITWTLDDTLTFKLSNYGILDDNSAFSIGRACSRSLSSSDIDPEDRVLLNFSNQRSGCISYFSRPVTGGTQYCCEGTNFFRILGRTGDDYILIYSGFDMPRYMVDGSSCSIKVAAQRIINGTTVDFDLFFQMAVHEDNANNAWIEQASIVGEDSYNMYYRIFRKGTYEMLQSKTVHSAWPEQ